MVARLLKSALVLVLLAGAFCAFHREALFEDKVYRNSWIFQNHAPFPEPEAGELNPLNPSSDLVTHYFPYKSVIATALKEGRFALWNPYVFCGFPLYANGSAAVFSPANLFMLLWPPYAAYKAELVLYFLAGAVLLFVYLRGIGASRAAAANGCLALIFAPFLVENVDFDTLHVFVWAFPLVLIAAERIAAAKKGSVAFAAAALFATALAGHIHVLINALVLFAGYVLVRAPRKTLKAGTALILFAALSAVLLYPMWNFMKSSQWITTSFATRPWVADLWRVPITPVTAIFPVVPKLPHFYEILSKAGHGLRFGSAVGIGIVPFVMGAGAILLLFSKATDRRARFFACLVLAYHASTVLPLFFWMPGVIGGFLDQSFDRLWQFYIFGSAVLTAWGTDAVVSSRRARNVIATLHAGLAASVVLPIAAAAAFVTLFGDRIQAKLASLMSAKGLLPEGSRQAERFPELFQESVKLFSFSSPHVVVPVAVIIALGGFLALARSQRQSTQSIARAGIGILILIDLAIWGGAVLPKPVDPERVYPRTAVTDFLAKDAEFFRVMSVQSPPERVLKPNLGVPYRLFDVGGQDSVLNGTYLHFGQRYLADRPEGALTVKGILDFEQINLNAASWLNVKYVLASDKAPAPAGLARVFEADGAAVYLNPGALPRVFFTRRYKRASGPEESFKAMAAEPPGAEPAIAVEAPNAPDTPRETLGPPSVPVIRLFSDGEMVVSINAPEDGWVVYTDNFDPGWMAFVDGERAQIARVNGLFKGVRVAPGTHAVRFVYRPTEFYRLAILSGLALVLTAWLLLRALL